MNPYPNPASKELYIDINGRINGTISIVNELGQLMLTQAVTNTTEKHNISTLPNRHGT